MAWSGNFSEDGFNWPLVADVDADYLCNLDPKGIGGWQSLISFLEEGVNEDDTIELYADDVERILRYAYCYRNGGFQSYLRKIFTGSDVWSFSEFHYCDNVSKEGPWDVS